MKKMILTAMMLAAAALCRAQQPAETGERREWLTSFTAVEVSAPLDVKFVQVPDTEAPKIVYDTKGSYTTKFRAEVKDKVLRITERSDARRPDRTSVTVYYNSLERVAIADAVATFDSTLVATVLDLTVGGMAQVTARMDVKDLKMELTGKSTATLTGGWHLRDWAAFRPHSLDRQDTWPRLVGCMQVLMTAWLPRIWRTRRHLFYRTPTSNRQHPRTNRFQIIGFGNRRMHRMIRPLPPLFQHHQIALQMSRSLQ